MLRDRLSLQDEIPDEALDAEEPPYYRPPEGSPAHEYLTARAAGPSAGTCRTGWSAAAG